MADTKLFDLTALAGTPASGDVLYICDVSDTTDGTDGTSKKITISNLTGGFATSGANSDITSLTGLTIPLSIAQGGTGNTVGASESQAGVSEIATAAETTIGTDATRAVSPDGLAGSDYGKRILSFLVFDDEISITTGNGAGDVFWRVPAILNGYNLVAVAAQVQTAGTTNVTTIQIYNVTQAADMLSTGITIDSGEIDSSTAAIPAVIDTANDDVTTGDQLRVDVDTISTTAPKGLLIELTFQLP